MTPPLAGIAIAAGKDQAVRLEVWSCGGGTQSGAIAVLIGSGKLPRPDFCFMTDTGREKSGTWPFVENFIRPQLAKAGAELHIVKTHDFGGGKLFGGEDGMSPLMPGFTTQSGSVGKLASFCSGAWKTDVGERYLRSIGVEKARNWIGISTDEMRQVRKQHRPWLEPKTSSRTRKVSGRSIGTRLRRRNLELTMTNLDIFNPQKVRGIVEKMEDEIFVLNGKVASLEAGQRQQLMLHKQECAGLEGQRNELLAALRTAQELLGRHRRFHDKAGCAGFPDCLVCYEEDINSGKTGEEVLSRLSHIDLNSKGERQQ